MSSERTAQDTYDEIALKEHWPWPTLDDWCRDFEQAILEHGIKVVSRDPSETWHITGYDGPAYFYHLQRGNYHFTFHVDERVAKTVMPRTFAVMRVINPILLGVET